MKRQKFTLAEVLVAVMIVAVTVPVLMRALSIDWRLDQQAAQRRLAAQLANMKLRELLLTRDWLTAETSGEFAPDYPGYTWELSTDEWNEGEVMLRQLNMTVRGPGGDDRAAVTLTALAPETALE